MSSSIATHSLMKNRFGLIAPAVASISSLVVYLMTLRTEVGRGDSAELALQAYQLGVTHPPGYPVHTIFGKLFTLFFHEPAVATNVMSAVFTCLTVGLLSLFLYKVTKNHAISLLGPFIFAFTPNVWQMAVTTEVYNVNILFLSLSFYLLFKWHTKPSHTLLFISAVIYGISLGSYLANLLLLPAFFYLIIKTARPKLTSLVLFSFVSGIVGILVLSWSYFRAGTVPPLGTEYPPTSPGNFLKYLAGAQYGTVEIQGFGFYLSRVLEHTKIFSKNFLGAGILLGLVGIYYLSRRDFVLMVTTLIVFVINICYFTAYNASDYFLMVTPAYFMFMIWVGCGAQLISEAKMRYVPTGLISWILLVVIATGLLFMQLPDKLLQHRVHSVTEHAISSLDILPKNAVVIVQWQNLTPLLYFQTTRNLRGDLTIIERQEAPRFYSFGRVNGYLSYAENVVKNRPVVIDISGIRFGESYKTELLGHNWYLVEKQNN